MNGIAHRDIKPEVLIHSYYIGTEMTKAHQPGGTEHIHSLALPAPYKAWRLRCIKVY